MYNIIFLDIDGVLNCNAYKKERQEDYFVDEDKVKIFSKLVHEVEDVKLILHSAWRFWFDEKLNPKNDVAKNLIILLAKYQISISGMTPDLTTPEIHKTKKFSKVKAKEILLYLQENPNFKNWVVIDDLWLMNDLVKRHQIKTDAKIGLTLDDVIKAKNFFDFKSEF